MLIQCCVCKKIESGNTWIPTDGVIYEASHTYCPDCVEVALSEIQAYRDALQSKSICRSGKHLRLHAAKPLYYTGAHAEHAV